MYRLHKNRPGSSRTEEVPNPDKHHTEVYVVMEEWHPEDVNAEKGEG